MKKQVCVIPFTRDFLLEYTKLAPTPIEIAESVDMMTVEMPAADESDDESGNEDDGAKQEALVAVVDASVEALDDDEEDQEQ